MQLLELNDKEIQNSRNYCDATTLVSWQFLTADSITLLKLNKT